VIEKLVIEVLIFLVGGVLGFVARTLVSPYISEKSKNLATKQDIGDITEKIESVRADYAENLEYLRHELQLHSTIREAFRPKAMEAIETINEVLVLATKHRWAEMA
ncbi:unnamed protein product, partial [Laminaria digitata]